MPTVDWNYHRKNCNSCSLAQAFFDQHDVAIQDRVDARSTPLVESDALRLLETARDLYVTRGTKVIHFDLNHDHPGNESIMELVIGRSGKLRAPTIKVGKTLVVGFDQATYEQVLSK
jgi:arsenate reductase-like glutaredoxin family protein